MKFFIDTANLNDIKEAQALGVLDGVTTNPSLMAKEGITGRNKVNNTEDNKENSKEENRPTRNYNNYKEIIAIERPTKDQITSSLLTYLFCPRI